MAELDNAVMEQLASLVTAVNSYQSAALEEVALDRKALLDALEMLDNMDSTVEQKVITMIGQPSSYFNNLTDIVKQVLSGMPDLGSVDYTLPDQILLDAPSEISFSGATTASGEPIVYKLSNPVNCTLSEYELLADEISLLTPLGGGPGSVTMTAVSNGVPAAPMVIEFNIIAGEMDLSGFVHNVANSYFEGKSATVTFNGATASDGSQVSYRFSDKVGVSTSADTVDDGGSVALTMTGPGGSTGSFNVVVVAGSIESDPIPVSFLISTVTVDMTGFSHDVGSSYLSGATDTVSLSGAVVSDGSAVSYQISNLQGVTASSTTTSDQLTLTVTGSAGSAASFTVIAVGGGAESVPVQVNFLISAVTINMTGFTHNVASSYLSGISSTVSMGGAVASDGSPVTYQISNLQGVAVSTATVSSQVTLTVTGSPGSAASFAVVAKAAGVESAPVQINFLVSSVTINISGFTHNIASSYINGQTATLTFSGATASDGSSVSYSFSHLTGCSLNLSTAASGQSVQMTVNGSTGLIGITAVSGSASSSVQFISFSIQNATVNRPSIQSPYNGATNVSRTPVLTSSGFATNPGGADSHSQSQWQAKNSSGTVIWDSGSTSQKTSISVPELPANSQIKFWVRHYGSQLGWSSWSSEVSVQTEASIATGHVYSDGSVAGPVVAGYRLIVAPPSLRGSNVQWGMQAVDTPLTNVTSESANDPQSGMANTNTLIAQYGSLSNQGPAAAKHCRNLGSQWFLPNKQELAEILKVKSTLDAASGGGITFASMGTGWIWTSTEASVDFIWAIRASDASITYISKDNWRYVVPVRREAI